MLAHIPQVGKGSGNPAPKLADRWKIAVWLGKSDFTDEHPVRTDEGVVYAVSVRRLAEHSWSEENLRAVVETPQRPKTTIAGIPLAAEMRRKSQQENRRKTTRYRESQWTRKKHLERPAQAEG